MTLKLNTRIIRKENIILKFNVPNFAKATMDRQILKIKNKITNSRGLRVDMSFIAPKNIENRKKLKAVLLVLLLGTVILTGFFGQSQAGANVADGADNVPISPKLAINVQTIDGSVIAAHIEVSSDGKTFSSDLSGINVYEISLPNGRYEITVSQPGYFASKQEINLEKDLAIIAALAKIPVPIAETPVPQPVVTRQPSTVHENIKNSKKTSPKSTKAPQRTATPSPATSADSVRTDMSVAGILDQINHQRSVNGLNSVSLNQTLSSAATAKAKDMATKNYFAHTSSEGIDDFYFINQVGYSWQAAGINLADGSFGDAKGLVDAWMNSSGHRANILATFGREIGIAIYGKYFVMMIASPR